MNENPTGSPEQITPGITLEWLDNRRIYAFALRTSHRAALDGYKEAGLDIINGWSPDQPYLTLQDTSHPDVGFSPYLRNLGNIFMDAILARGLRGRIAVVVPNTFAGQLIKMFSRALSPRSSAVEIRVFMERDEALAWLRQRLGA